MKKTTYKTLLASIVLIATSQQIQAQENSKTVCSHSGNTRIIEVVYPDAENRPVCEVVYTNKTGSKVLWNAQNDASYCEQKASEFIAKQEGWGWSCKLEETSQEEIEEFEDELGQEGENKKPEDEAQTQQEKSEQEELEAQAGEESQDEAEEETENTEQDDKEENLEQELEEKSQEAENTEAKQDLESEKADIDAEVKKLKKEQKKAE